MLAIVWATKYFRHYIFGRQVTVFTDHQPLSWVAIQKSSSPRLVRWSLYLSEFDLVVKFRAGKNNNADLLSRIPANDEAVNSVNTSPSGDDIPQEIRAVSDLDTLRKSQGKIHYSKQ